jgi:hypothetical protein
MERTEGVRGDYISISRGIPIARCGHARHAPILRMGVQNIRTPNLYKAKITISIGCGAPVQRTHKPETFRKVAHGGTTTNRRGDWRNIKSPIKIAANGLGGWYFGTTVKGLLRATDDSRRLRGVQIVIGGIGAPPHVELSSGVL